MNFETHSGLPFNSIEQRQHYENLRKKCLEGLDDLTDDSELFLIPVFNIYKDYRIWQKLDFKNKIPEISAMQMFLNNYYEFKKNTKDLRFVCSSKLAAKDISQNEYDYIEKELNLRELFMESQLNPSKKKIFNNSINETEKKEFFERLGDSVIYNSKRKNNDGCDTTENESSEVDV